ncbi:MAG: glutamyl-tRNA reductase, partial [Lentisphaerales bacterium]
RGRVSVSSIAVDFAQKVFESLSAKSVMIVGAGETGELTLKSLVDKGVKEIFVLNRSLEKGKAIAEQYGGTAVQFDLLEEYLTRSDIVISCTGAPHCVIKVHAVRNAVAARHNQPILLIDIAVPRDIEEDVGKLENVYLYHIDDLHRVAGENMAKRQKAVEHAWRIVRKEAAEFAALDGGIVLLMKEIDDRAREIKETELIKAFRKEKLAPLPEPCKEEIRMMVHRVINKVLAAPRDVLNEAARNGRWEKYASVARSLFKLGGENDDGDR